MFFARNVTRKMPSITPRIILMNRYRTLTNHRPQPFSLKSSNLLQKPTSCIPATPFLFARKFTTKQLLDWYNMTKTIENSAPPEGVHFVPESTRCVLCSRVYKVDDQDPIHVKPEEPTTEQPGQSEPEISQKMLGQIPFLIVAGAGYMWFRFIFLAGL